MAAPHGSGPKDLGFVDAARRGEEARERTERRRCEAAERRLGGLHRGEVGLAQNRDQREIGGRAQLSEIDVADLAGERMAPPMQFAEPIAEGLETGVVDHGPRPYANQRLRRL